MPHIFHPQFIGILEDVWEKLARHKIGGILPAKTSLAKPGSVPYIGSDMRGIKSNQITALKILLKKCPKVLESKGKNTTSETKPFDQSPKNIHTS